MGKGDRSEFLHGTLEMLILQILDDGPENGYAIGRAIRDRSGHSLIVEEGSLYPALYRMERHGWVGAKWGQSENRRRAKFYRLTRTGRAQLEHQLAGWAEFVAGVGRVTGQG